MLTATTIDVCVVTRHPFLVSTKTMYENEKEIFGSEKPFEWWAMNKKKVKKGELETASARNFELTYHPCFSK